MPSPFESFKQEIVPKKQTNSASKAATDLNVDSKEFKAVPKSLASAFEQKNEQEGVKDL